MNNYGILLFKKPDKDRLQYVSANRTGKAAENVYDIVIGPVANDQTIKTINNCLKEYFSEDITIQ